MPTPAMPLQPATAALTTDDALVAFVHINKCGGTSVSQALKSCDLPTSRFADSPRASRGEWLHHHTLRAYARMNPTRNVSSLRSFAIVRDPYARMVSLFYYLAEKPALGVRNGEMPSPSDLPSPSELRANASAMVPFFQAWLYRLNTRYPVGSADARFFTGMRGGVEGPRRDASQTAWLEDEAGDVPRGLVLLTLNETLDAQWRRLTRTMLPECTGVELPHEKSSGSHYVSTAEHFAGDGGVAASILEAHVARDFGPPLRFSRLAQQRERPRVDAGLWWEGERPVS